MVLIAKMRSLVAQFEPLLDRAEELVGNYVSDEDKE
jgi:hypothetical protein